ncbi:uncharacterized protein LOC113563625 isoform X2 [Ooceraea biroi]|uniref:uncharacterized protein LOC105283408 isoform X2 n=1 Tax=Ooceraea biroi TaxID=2015173 RepID=UPI000F08BF97|nr:uncharacterized protein LOC105283408 isoform X2 [Ooceraea biroi]XP_026831265.1 uncharacterized protein LOC113563625 isoform X2 [Ooceraea biroi]
MNSIVNNRNRDCFECRLLSGGGLFAAGLYVYHHSKQYHNQIGKATMYSIASDPFLSPYLLSLFRKEIHQLFDK